MLNQTTLKQIAELLKISAEDFTAAVTSEDEQTLELPQVVALTDEELTRIKNDEYNKGKEKSVEMAVKDVKKALNLDFQGKSIEGLVEAATRKAIADAGIEPDKKVKELEKDLQTLRQHNELLNSQIKEKDSTLSQAQIEREIFRELPTLGEGTIGVDKLLKVMRVDGIEALMHEGKLVAAKDGEVIKDKTANPVLFKDYTMEYAKENKFISDGVITPTGRGAGDGKQTAVYTKLSEVEAAFKAQGKSTNGEEFLNKVSDLAKANPDFKMME